MSLIYSATAEFPRTPLLRLSGKCSVDVMVAYAPHHGKQEIPHRSVRRRMALHRPASSQTRRGWGRPRLHGLRALLDAVFYILKSSCPWRLLPRDFPPWKTVYDWFRRWRIDGTWERLNAELRERLRARLGRRTRTPAPGSWTPSPPRRPASAGSKGAMTGVRRSAAESDTCSWIRKAWYSELGSTAPRCTTRTALRCCWSRRAPSSLA